MNTNAVRCLLAILIGTVIDGATVSARQADDSETAVAIERALRDNPFRKENDASRDTARNPAAFFRFLGLKPTMAVGEVNPGGGWYSRILGPYLRANGQYVGLEHNPDQYEGYTNYAATLRAYPDKLEQNRAMLGRRALAAFLPAKDGLPVAEGSLDAVIAVRALHNWVRQDFFDAATGQIWAILKPGGVFGVVQHRADEDFNGDFRAAAAKGRWRQSELVAAIEARGFRLEAASEMNANPRDTKDYEHGVWTLPPRFALGDQDRARYSAIGESDRMTLKFVKIAK